MRSNTRSIFATKSRESGAIFLLFLPLLAVLLLLLLGGIAVAKRAQDSIALDARLDICAVRIVSQRMALLQALVKSNQLLSQIRLAIYALRGAKLIPVVQVLAAASEPELLAAAQAIVIYQNTLIASASITEWPEYLCPRDPYSSTASFCQFSPLKPQDFQREELSDVPESLHLLGTQKLLEVHCESRLQKKRHIRSLELHGSPSLEQANFSYRYEPES